MNCFVTGCMGDSAWTTMITQLNAILGWDFVKGIFALLGALVIGSLILRRVATELVRR